MLKDSLKKDLNDALKSGNSLKRSTLGMVLSAIKNREVEKRSKLSKSGIIDVELEQQSNLVDDEVVEVIATEIKKRKDAFEQFTSAGRDELAQKERSEIEILSFYLPQQMGDVELRELILQSIKDTGAVNIKDMGAVMNAVMAHAKGRVQGSEVSNIVKDMLK